MCIDEKSTQLLAHSRAPLPMKHGCPVREDYEYMRRGTCNPFVVVEPKAGHRTVHVTARRGKADFVAFARHLIENVCGSARRIHLVLDKIQKSVRIPKTRRKRMKITLDLNDALLTEAKTLAAQQRTSLARLIEEGLRLRLRKDQAPRKRVCLPVHRGKGGLVSGLNALSNKSLLSAADQGS